LSRSIGSPQLGELDPFLLLDEFNSEEGADYVAGFPDHPHRGFETVTYMIHGAMRHEDSKGESGSLVSGGVQWMTAGRGIVHSEMPEQRDGLMQGFQLWVNLPARDKMCEPRYQNIEPEDVPEVLREDGVKIRVVAGEAEGVRGAVQGIAVEPTYLDIIMPAGTTVELPVAEGHAAFCYVFEGEALAGATDEGAGAAVAAGHLAVLGDGEAVRVRAATSSARLLLVAGRPLNEPIVRYGPFVMNTKDEILQAVRDFQSGQF
ncbi:MAG: pirin family protein, partial [Alphaproteobacteria bacterium]